MSQSMKLKIKGLHTYSSEISGVPNGALSIARNVDITRLNIVGPRRGYNYLEQDLPLTADRVSKLVFYNSETLAHYNDATFALYDSGSGFLGRGSIAAPSAAPTIKTAKANKNLYLTSSTGMQKMDDTASSIFQAGLPQGIHTEAALDGTGTAVEIGNNVAYRYLIGVKDANGNLIRGGVSSRVTLANGAGSTQDVALTCYIPDGLSTSHFVQLYRSIGSTGTPSDEMQLAYEHNITSTDISNGYVSIDDITPDALLGAFLYTSPSQETISNNNFEPPVAHDVTEYKGRLFFGDVSSKHRFTFTLIGIGSPDGLVVDDTITIDDGTTSEVYTAKATESVGSKHFEVVASGSVETRLADTASSLVKIINEGSSNWYAYLLSTGSTGLPGGILLEERSYGGEQFDVTSDRETAFSPQLASAATDSQKSSNDEFKNGLMFSKAGQPEAVPLKNIFFVGSSDDRIKRIIALRDGLFIFKTDGVYVLRGQDESSFSVQPLDLTAKIISSDSIEVVNNMIYGLFDAGVCEVSDSGVSVVSIPIKEQFEELMSDTLTSLDTYGFGVSDQVNGKYILALPSNTDDTSCVQQFVFDTNGKTWVKWDLDITCGRLNPNDNKVHLGKAQGNQIYIERKSFDYTDYADFGDTLSIVSYSGTSMVLSSVAGVGVGDYLEQDAIFAYIESVDSTTSTVVVDLEQAWTTGVTDVTWLKAIDCEIEWNPDFADNPAGMKIFYEANILLKQDFQKEFTTTFFSDINRGPQEIILTASTGNGAFGDFEFGDIIFGGEIGRVPRRVGIPREKARCNQLSFGIKSKIVYSDFLMNGVSLSYNKVSTRTAR